MINLVKGTHDIVKDEARKYFAIETFLRDIALSYNFVEFRTPIIEYTNLFQRTTGEGSDIVRKEMYTFLDKGDRSITLRPEMTAGVIRSIVNNKFLALGDYPVKAFYYGPCFRYERPQVGRYRQFHQFGVESLGLHSAYRDVEVILLCYDMLKKLGFNDIILKINCLGDDETRINYTNALKEYFSNHIQNMCEDCKERFNLNILRILDCKVESDKEIVKNAPKISDYLSDASKEYMDQIKFILNAFSIDYVEDPSLVRGLDYYSDIVFEFSYVTSSGVDYGAIAGGGHYNKLVSELGGPKDVEGCGFSIGLERLISIMNDEGLFDETEVKDTIYVTATNKELLRQAFMYTNYLRDINLKAECLLEQKSLKSALKKASKDGALAVIFGEEEFKNGNVIIKDLIASTQEIISINDSADYLNHKIDKILFVGGNDECCHHEHRDGCCCHHHHDSNDEEECECHSSSND